MIEYIYIDKKDYTKSIAQFDGVQFYFWNVLFEEYTKNEVEAFIKAEIKFIKGEFEEAIQIATPFISGSKNGDIDTRSFLKKWYDEKEFE